MENNNIAVCTNCGSSHKLSDVNLYTMTTERITKDKDVEFQYSNVEDAVCICPSCKSGLIIEYEAIDGLDIETIDANDIFDVENFATADIIYNGAGTKKVSSSVLNTISFNALN